MTADSSTIDQGATLTVTHIDPTSGALGLAISIPSEGISNLALVDGGPGSAGEGYTAALAGGETLTLDLRHLDYVTFGAWTISSSSGAATELSVLAGGLRTPSLTTLAGASATASYAGGAVAVVTVPNGATYETANLVGTATLNANFGTGAVSGSFANVTATPTNGGAAAPWNNVVLSATIAGGGFSGSAQVDSTIATGPYAMASSASGHFDGAFYGPAANEVGAIWTLSDGTNAAIGVIGLPANSGTGGVEAESTGGSGVTVNDDGNVSSVGVGIEATSGANDYGIQIGLDTPPQQAAGVSPNLGSGPYAAAGTQFPLFPAVETAQAPADVGSAFTPSFFTSYEEAEVAPANSDGSQVELTIPTLGIDVTLPVSGSQAVLNNRQWVHLATFGPTNLGFSYAEWGEWDTAATQGGAVANQSWFSTGFQTPADAMPTTGTATYGVTGGVPNFNGDVYAPGGEAGSGLSYSHGTIAGYASLTANFGSGAISGAVTNTTVTDTASNTTAPWNNLSISATISGATFGGSTTTATTPAGSLSLGAATGTVSGAFYGPTANEAAAVVALSDGTRAAFGAFGGQRQAASK